MGRVYILFIVPDLLKTRKPLSCCDCELQCSSAVMSEPTAGLASYDKHTNVSLKEQYARYCGVVGPNWSLRATVLHVLDVSCRSSSFTKSLLIPHLIKGVSKTAKQLKRWRTAALDQIDCKCRSVQRWCSLRV